MAERSTNLRYSQIIKTIDKMFDNLTKIQPLENKEHVQALWMSLYQENLIPTAPPSIANPLDALSTIKRKLSKIPEARTVIQTWLLTVRRQYRQKFLYNERIHGLQVLFEYTQQDEISYDDEEIHRWLGKLSLDILTGGDQVPGPNSVFAALHAALIRQSKSLGKEKGPNTMESRKSIKEALKMNIENRKSTKELLDLSKGNDWKEIVRTEPVLQSNIPFFLLFAADVFEVRVCILCYPSTEEVTFYPTKPTEKVIRIGLLHKDHYVCIIPKDKEKTHAQKVKGLEASIKDLKKNIHRCEQKIEELEKEGEKNKKKIAELSNEKSKLEKELEEKEREKARLIEIARQNIQEMGMEMAKKFADKYELQIANLD